MKIRNLIPLFMFVLLIGAFAFGLTRNPQILPSELIEKPFPNFELENLAGDTDLDARIFEGEVSIVNVFGSWCTSCVIEHPILIEMSRSGDFQMVGVNWRDTQEDAQRWLGQYGNPYDKIIFDPNSRLVVNLGVVGAPETFIVDHSGSIRYKHVGVVDADDWSNDIRPILLSLLIEAEK